METIARYFSEGGPIMWPILAVLGFAGAVIAERLYFYLVTCRDNARTLVAAAARALNEGQTDNALRSVSGGRGPLNVILRVALQRYRDGYAMTEIRQAVDEAAIREVPRLAQRIGYLSTLANVATLSGLLGTIFGLQQAFSSLAMVDASAKASVLAAGISQAMNTTSLGLIVAIPCLVAHALLANLQSQRAEDLDAGAVRLLNYLENRLSTPAHSAPRAAAVGEITHQDQLETAGQSAVAAQLAVANRASR